MKAKSNPKRNNRKNRRMNSVTTLKDSQISILKRIPQWTVHKQRRLSFGHLKPPFPPHRLPAKQ